MKMLAGILFAALLWPCLAVDRMTAVSVDGVSYLQIQDAHVLSGGRVALTLPSGGATVPADKLPKAFLDSWGITPDQLSAATAAAKRQKESELNQSVRAGLFRDVEGVVYDLRKPQAGWVRLSGAKILSTTPEGALLDAAPGKTSPTLIIVRNLPSVYADNEIISVFAKAVGPFTFASREGERTVRGYDAGRACAHDEIPESILRDGLAFASLTNAPKRQSHPVLSSLDPDQPHGVGSGFFVTKDGYLLTNHHVVDGAKKIEINYRGRLIPAKVVADDPTNDLAVLKVEGRDFASLSISRKEPADLGQEVFTIGFPNIRLQGVEPKYTDGKISSLKGAQDDPAMADSSRM